MSRLLNLLGLYREAIAEQATYFGRILDHLEASGPRTFDSSDREAMSKVCAALDADPSKAVRALREHLERKAERRCAVCGDALTGRTDRVTCSPRCRVALMRRRKRDRLSRLADG